jgi:hypothetical protein
MDITGNKITNAKMADHEYKRKLMHLCAYMTRKINKEADLREN